MTSGAGVGRSMIAITGPHDAAAEGAGAPGVPNRVLQPLNDESDVDLHCRSNR